MSSSKQGSLFNTGTSTRRGNWRPPESLPVIQGKFKKVGFDCESTGKDKHTDRRVGIAIATPDGAKCYLPTGHQAGGNLDKLLVGRWARTELRNVQLVGLNIGFDAEVERNTGTDLEAQGCTLRDVAHSAALLNERRYGGFNLDSLGKEYAGHGKRPLDIPGEDIHRVHSSLIGEYAEDDAALALEVDEKQAPQIEAEGLDRVLHLEDQLIWANNHIERSGARLDKPKLQQWCKSAKQQFSELILEIFRLTGLRLNPNSGDDWSRLFKHLNLENPHVTAGINPKESFTKEYLATISHPVVKLGLRARRIAGIQSKYLDKYLKLIGDGDILRFSLYQLRSSDGDYGTITGRYSSANVNIQQVMKVEKQIEEFGDEFIIRELMIADDGFDFFAGDASQIEFRLFAHYSGSERLIKQYNENPFIDFHQMVADMMKQKRHHAKHNNFGKLYTMGIVKLANRLGLDCNCGCFEAVWDKENHSPTCPMIEAIRINEEYDAAFPEARKLTKRAMKLAEQRLYVRTILGRRGRFSKGDSFHPALNKVIQGSAADVFKTKMLSLYNNRHTIGIHKLRMPVHDEQTGDLERGEGPRKRLKECFAEQDIEIKVPIIWDLEFGNNWRECA